jgi:hypothetical protein
LIASAFRLDRATKPLPGLRPVSVEQRNQEAVLVGVARICTLPPSSNAAAPHVCGGNPACRGAARSDRIRPPPMRSHGLARVSYQGGALDRSGRFGERRDLEASDHWLGSDTV